LRPCTPPLAIYLSNLSWDPTTASYWDAFDADLDELDPNEQLGGPGFRSFDTRLDSQELSLFKRNGFVVSQRLGGDSFADVFYKLWHDDLPVYISTDALLHAWHRTYDAMLQEIEETYLFNSMETLLDRMAAEVTEASREIGNGVLRESLLDADYFLTIARSLLARTNDPPVSSILNQEGRVADTLADIRAGELKIVTNFMGFCRTVDFSQFKVRGHYTRSERLGRYFQCVMWLGRIDIPVAGGPWQRCPNEGRMASPRELGTAIVLFQLLNSSAQFNNWRDMEQVIQTFVGPTDSMTFGQLGGLLAGASIRNLTDVKDSGTLEKIQADIVAGQLGVQNIRSDWFQQPLGGTAQYALPQTFTVFGQKFVPDSWALSQTVFSSILWAENGQTNKVQRRVPSALDVAFAVLGNDQVVPELLAQMKGTFPDSDRPHGMTFRDGFPYQHNLAAVRAVIDLQESGAWDSNIYMNWLSCLRDLSTPTTDVIYPEAMRTRAWAMKTLNTQLASWTQLRHDTILYAKQSYTEGGGCVYPIGFVELRPTFWRRLKEMASAATDRIEGLHYDGFYQYISNQPPTLDPTSGDVVDLGGPQTNTVPLAVIQNRQVDHLRNFANVIARLETLVEKQLAQQCFGSDDQQFIDSLMEGPGGFGCHLNQLYSGWYPRLFYRAIYWTDDNEFQTTFGAGAFDALVADVHTDVPSDSDVGSVLHEAVGGVNLLMLAVDNGPDRFICAGPVLSHYELEVTGPPRRLSDEDWAGHDILRNGILQSQFPDDLPPSRVEGLTPPVWTKEYSP
jgi:hypothetical protein